MADTNTAPGPRRGLGTGGIIAIVLGALLVVGIVGGGAALVLTRQGDDEVVILQTEPLNTAAAAFTPPMGTDTPVTTPPAVSGLQTVPAETAGLFGGTLQTSSCDKAKLVAFLQTNPEKARGWAQTLGISAAGIPDFVTSLTPVLLRSDTAVTNHGFDNGAATSFPALLQAGTAVLVNEVGQPVVKCYCGNPLTAPPQNMTKARYTGPTWPAFRPGVMTVVQSAPATIANYVLVDVVTNQTFVRPAATDGAKDSPRSAPPATATPTPTPAPSTAAPTAEAPTPNTEAPSVPAAESGREATAIELAKASLRACAATVDSGGDFESVLAKASFVAVPSGGAGAYRVTMTDTSGTFVYTVNVASRAVVAVSADALEVADNCPGVFG